MVWDGGGWGVGLGVGRGWCVGRVVERVGWKGGCQELCLQKSDPSLEGSLASKDAHVNLVEWNACLCTQSVFVFLQTCCLHPEGG